MKIMEYVPIKDVLHSSCELKQLRSYQEFWKRLYWRVFHTLDRRVIECPDWREAYQNAVQEYRTRRTEIISQSQHPISDLIMKIHTNSSIELHRNKMILLIKASTEIIYMRKLLYHAEVLHSGFPDFLKKLDSDIYDRAKSAMSKILEISSMRRVVQKDIENIADELFSYPCSYWIAKDRKIEIQGDLDCITVFRWMLSNLYLERYIDISVYHIRVIDMIREYCHNHCYISEFI